MPTPETWIAPAKDRLKKAIKLKQEARQWKKAAISEEAAGETDRALQFRMNGSYPEAAAQELMEQVRDERNSSRKVLVDFIAFSSTKTERSLSRPQGRVKPGRALLQRERQFHR